MSSGYSVVIPTKNEAMRLPLLLTSLLGQTMQPREVIVADAESTDTTREVAAAFGARVVEGGLPGVGRNRGAEVAQGEWIVFFDADVVLTDSTLIERWITSATKANLEMAIPEVMPSDGTVVDRALYRLYNAYVHLVFPLKPHAAGIAILVKKGFHERLSGFDETVLFCEDHDYAMRAAKIGKVHLVSNIAIETSVRRLQRDGRIGTMVRYVLAELHLWFLGPIRHDRFRYRFGHHS